MRTRKEKIEIGDSKRERESKKAESKMAESRERHFVGSLDRDNFAEC